MDGRRIRVRSTPPEHKPGSLDSQPSAGAQRALDVLATFPTQAASSADWRSAIEKGNGKPIPPRTFENRRGELVKRGLVERCPHDPALYRVVGQSATSANGTPFRRKLSAAATAAYPLVGSPREVPRHMLFSDAVSHSPFDSDSRTSHAESAAEGSSQNG